MKYIILAFLLIAAALPFITKAQDWRSAERGSAGIAPLPKDEPRAIVQIYAARAYGWRGNYAVHSWVATKAQNAKAYDVYQVVGFRSRRNLPVVMVEKDLPDRKWFDHTPELLFELRGDAAAKMIPDIKQAAKNYPYQNFYRLWPGPNSNSFVAYIIRHTPGIYLELPPHAIGKDWIDDGKFFGPSESGTGYQLSIYGALGLTVGLAEGIEVNILGLTFGVDVMRPALKLPFIGRVGLKDRPVFGPKAIPEKEKSEDDADPMVTPGAV